MAFKKRQIARSGQSLFEVIVAVGIVSLILVGVVALSTTSIRNTSFARNKALATKFALDGVECLRELKDSNWNTFKTTGHNACNATDSIFTRTTEAFTCMSFVAFPVPTPPVETTLSCDEVEVNRVDVVIEVSWTDSQGLHNVRSPVTLTKWR